MQNSITLFLFIVAHVIVSQFDFPYGEEVSLTCIILDGTGLYNFTLEVPPGSSSETLEVDTVTSATLTFIALPDDSGTYICKVDGIVQTISVDITVGKGIVLARMKVVGKYSFFIVPAIMNVDDVTVKYSDDATATFSCTAHGGNDESLVFFWSPLNYFNSDTQVETKNADNSTTSTITTHPLSLNDRMKVLHL